MKFHDKNIFEITFYARGGQGAKTAAEIIAQAAVSEGKNVQSFPSFGPERSGAQTTTYVRVSKEKIRTHEPIVDPDISIVLDETLLGSVDVTKGLDRNEALIINSKMPAGEIAQKTGFKGKIYPIDANGISMEIVGQPRPNTVILGKIIQVTEVVRLESIMAEFRKIFEDKIGRDATEKNLAAISKAYDSI
jgi:pyruvate ferredoxin oxidoreductase gamma subunit